MWFLSLHGFYHRWLVFSLHLGQGVLFLPDMLRWRFCFLTLMGWGVCGVFSCYFWHEGFHVASVLGINCPPRVSGGFLAEPLQPSSLRAKSAIFHWFSHDTRFPAVFIAVIYFGCHKPVALPLFLSGDWSAREGVLSPWMDACGSCHA